jgi:hypothetical protein
MTVRALVLTVLFASASGAVLAPSRAIAQAQVLAQSRVIDEPTAVSPVTVMPPTLPPKVVSSYPAQGQTIGPGVLIVKVAFDQKMNPKAWNYGTAPSAERPECIKTPRLLNDQKTFVLLCRVLSDRTYGLALNAERVGGFANQADNPAEAYSLIFQVVRGEPVTSMARALKAAGLKDDEEPIEEAPKPPARPTP